jgi:DNA-binding IclR family transcriptional regulator
MPALCTGLGKVLTAFCAHDAGEEIIEAGVGARTPHTVTKPWKIRRGLARIRDDGVGYDREESDLGMWCIAAPVTRPDGSCIAAVSLTGPSSRLNLNRAAPLVCRAAHQASLALATTRAA